jgi:hypothetical protein
MAETSFSRAPLNSRLPPISPHRLAKGKARAQEEDDPAPPPKTGEALEHLSVDLQEAMMIEDLLFVLSVSLLFFTLVVKSLTRVPTRRELRGSTSSLTPPTPRKTSMNDYSVPTSS